MFKDTKGSIIFHGTLRRGVIRIGSPNCLATKDLKFERTIIDISGNLEVEGSIHFAPGSRISIDDGAVLKIGDGFNSTGNLTIICNKSIEIGNNCLVSWDVQMMDTDFHEIFDSNGQLINPASPIKIGDNVWLTSKVAIYKGVNIADGCVIAGASVITKSFESENCIIGGHGFNSKILKSNIHWRR